MAERVYDIYLWQEIVVPPLTVKKSVGIIAGHVFDSAGKPVNGALITTNQDAKTVTDKNGCFRLEGLHSDWVELKVKSNDGEEAHQDFHDGKPDVKIVLTSKRPT
jgi:protocatechuate 3,4-dioxygenase beta subunit